MQLLFELRTSGTFRALQPSLSQLHYPHIPGYQMQNSTRK